MDSQILTILESGEKLDVDAVSTADYDGRLVMSVGRVLGVGSRDCSKICPRVLKKTTRKLSQDSQ
jgi:hypothetical protein